MYIELKGGGLTLNKFLLYLSRGGFAGSELLLSVLFVSVILVELFAPLVSVLLVELLLSVILVELFVLLVSVILVELSVLF